MTTAIYVRVSTEDQTTASQEHDLRAYCERRGWSEIQGYSDQISGANFVRPGLDALMAAVRIGKVERVIVSKLDRLGRSLPHLALILDELQRHGVALIATSQGIDTGHSNPVGRLQLNVLMAVAEFEREIIRERVNTGLAAARARGVKLGRRPTHNWTAADVKVYGGAKHGVVGCDIYQAGQGGIHLEGDDRKTLTPAGHYADNNHVHHTARWDPVYQQGITAFGVGNSVTHNLIDHVPHIAIGFTGNDQVIEYNEIHSAVFQPNDAGAIYTSPPDETWSMRGHRIRYNYLHDIRGFRSKGCFGVYLDDCFSSADISGNVFYDVATAILIGGGRDNIIMNNMFIKCDRAFSIDARGLGWAKGVGDFTTKELIALNYKQPPWSIHYPELLNLLEDEPLAPKGNVVARNICWGGKWGSTEAKAVPFFTNTNNFLDTDPRFRDAPSFQLEDDSPALKLGFQRIPFEKIGLYQSEDRASWPIAR
jgi:DNA invertase Pin-like site-specific DNA recombinase